VSKLALLLMDFCSHARVTRTMVAAMLGIQPSHLSEFEHLRRPIPFATMKKLCDLFSCEPSDILGMADEGTNGDILLLDTPPIDETKEAWV
jgi:DNA-binding Xre family transcriptional regulator